MGRDCLVVLDLGFITKQQPFLCNATFDLSCMQPSFCSDDVTTYVSSLLFVIHYSAIIQHHSTVMFEVFSHAIKLKLDYLKGVTTLIIILSNVIWLNVI